MSQAVEGNRLDTYVFTEFPKIPSDIEVAQFFAVLRAKN
jgi:hypothetical protein